MFSTCDEGSVPDAFVHLRNHGGASDAGAEEEDDGEDDARRHEHGVAWRLLAVDGFSKLNGDLAVFGTHVAV